MYHVCSAVFNIGKKHNDIVSFLFQVFPLYFPSGESGLAKKVPGLEKAKKKGKRKRVKTSTQVLSLNYSPI